MKGKSELCQYGAGFLHFRHFSNNLSETTFVLAEWIHGLSIKGGDWVQGGAEETRHIPTHEHVNETESKHVTHRLQQHFRCLKTKPEFKPKFSKSLPPYFMHFSFPLSSKSTFLMILSERCLV